MLEGRPSLDDRFAVGWCPRCTPLPRQDPQRPNLNKKRGTVVLAQDTEATRAGIAERERRKAEAKLVERVTTNKTDNKTEIAQAHAIRQRWAAEAAARRGAG